MFTDVSEVFTASFIRTMSGLEISEHREEWPPHRGLLGDEPSGFMRGGNLLTT
jgi:hypothetical protein